MRVIGGATMRSGSENVCQPFEELSDSRCGTLMPVMPAEAAAAGWGVRTAHKWIGRWRSCGRGACRSLVAPRRIPHRTPADRVEAIAAWRKLRGKAAEIASVFGMRLSTVSAVLKGTRLTARVVRFPPSETTQRAPGSRRDGSDGTRSCDSGVTGPFGILTKVLSGRAVGATQSF
jgi:hypothetical protein